MKKISDWVAGATLFMRYFSYICVWFTLKDILRVL